MEQAVVVALISSEVDVFAAKEVAGAEPEGVDEWERVLAGVVVLRGRGGDGAEWVVRGRDYGGECAMERTRRKQR